MYKILGIVNSSKKNINVSGLQDYRDTSALSFLGRYRIIDFSISNLSNSNIERILLYVGNHPSSLVEHIGTGRHYNINSKSGKIKLLFSNLEGTNYKTDINDYLSNIDFIEKADCDYVVITPSYMVFSADYHELIKQHAESGADVTLLYHNVDNANEEYLENSYLNLNRQKGVKSIALNRGNAKERSIFMDTYILSKEILLYLIQMAHKRSSMYTLEDIVNLSCEDLDIRGISHKGYFASINSLNDYFKANMALLDTKKSSTLFSKEWPVYTRTNDSQPTHYYNEAKVTGSYVANGCLIQGTVENSVIGRGCVIKKGAVVKNSIVLANTTIGEDVVVECQVIDKNVSIERVKNIVSTYDKPGYIKKNDTL